MQHETTIWVPLAQVRMNRRRGRVVFAVGEAGRNLRLNFSVVCTLPQRAPRRRPDEIYVMPATLALAMGWIAAPAQAAGCLKGAAVGGIAGHYAGHHGVLGAGAGCVIGHHEATKHARERAQQQQQDSRREFRGDSRSVAGFSLLFHYGVTHLQR